MGLRVRHMKMLLVCALLAPLVLLFQNCSQANFLGGTTAQMSPGNGNGDFYGGKPTLYSHYETTACAQTGRDGKALPNGQILNDAPGSFKLVRENCADLEPSTIASADIQIASGNLVYAGRSYSADPVKEDFSVLAANCPTGRTLKANPVRTNLIPNAQDLTNTATWWNNDGITSSLETSIAGLPAYAITRTDASRLDYWRRAHPDLILPASKTYAVSFFARAGNVGEVYFAHVQGSDVISVILDISTGTVRVFEQTGFTYLATESRAIGNSRFFTIFFTTPAGLTQTAGALGFAPNGLDSAFNQSSRLGDTITLSTPQLEDVDSFCD